MASPSGMLSGFGLPCTIAHVTYISYHMISHWSCDLHPLSHDLPLVMWSTSPITWSPLVMWSTSPITWSPTAHVIYIPYHMISVGHVIYIPWWSTSLLWVKMFSRTVHILPKSKSLQWALGCYESVLAHSSLGACRWCLRDFSIKFKLLALWITYIVTIFSATGNPPGYHPCYVMIHSVILRNSFTRSVLHWYTQQ